MKRFGKPNSSIRLQKPSGFALVVTLTLMVLLSILALGLLSLSSVTLRTEQRSSANATARANALFALQLAIGDLQKHLGPDQRISANASVLGRDVAQPQIVGVWKSKKLDPGSTASDFSKSEKSNQFLKWLVSGADQTLLQSEAFAKQSPGAGDNLIELYSSVNLEAGAPGVTVRKVELTGKKPGSYAYAVIDEGVKARINMGTITNTGNELAEKSTSLGSGARPDLSGVEGIEVIPGKDVDLSTPEGRSRVGKMISMKTSEFSYGTLPGVLVRKSQDFTTYSAGVLANVADGGLKTDLNLLAETQNSGSLPAEYASAGIYQKELGQSPKPDPLWSRALGWANVFNTNAITSKTVGGLKLPTAKATVPTGWKAGEGVSGNQTTKSGSADLSGLEPPGPVLLPDIAKIQMSFALTARDLYDYPKGSKSVPPDVSFEDPKDIHEPQGDWFRANLNDRDAKGKARVFNSPVDYMLHLIYSPIITLHNPYNVPLDFNNLRVEFVNVPFSLQIYRNGVAQTNGVVPFSIMNDTSTAALNGTNKRFGLLITDTLLPGEVKVYSPNILPTRTWYQELAVGKGGKKHTYEFVDVVNQSAEDGRDKVNKADTSRATARVGWNGPAVGYSVEGFCKPVPKFPTDKVGSKTIQRGANIPLKKGDQIFTVFQPRQDHNLPEKKFSVEMTLDWEAGKKSRAAAYLFEFATYTNLENAMIKGNPQAVGPDANGRVTIRSPKGTDYWLTEQLFDHAQTELREMTQVKPFALFTAYAKTGMSGKIAGGANAENGLKPSKPFDFQSQSAVAIKQDMAVATASHYSHELAISRYPDDLTKGIGVQENTGRGKFLSGNTASDGRHFGILNEVPLAPLQSIVTLNGARLASGNSLPHFFAPLGNSHAHPLMNGTQPVETGPDGTPYADHSFLLNAALFDRYYCSGLQTHASVSVGGDGRTARQLISAFIATADSNNNTASPLPDPRIRARLSGGEIPTEAVAALQASDGFKSVAARQLIEGAFNVNSTSAAAWKAMLSSMSGDGAIALALPRTENLGINVAKNDLIPKADANGARFSRVRIPSAQPDREDVDGFWRGPIDLTEPQLNALATEIVAQVKLRGPFLSVAEFVNRQLGNAQTNKLAFSGAIQAAIKEAGINQGISQSAKAGYEISAVTADLSNLNLKTDDAILGESTQGAPGFLMQADVLAVLGNAVTVRSDTFTIRSYGEAFDKAGNIVARSYCEAVVQRLPEFVDSSNRAETSFADLAPANKNFGRRFELISLRWLTPSEI